MIGMFIDFHPTTQVAGQVFYIYYIYKIHIYKYIRICITVEFVVLMNENKKVLLIDAVSMSA